MDANETGDAMADEWTPRDDETRAGQQQPVQRSWPRELLHSVLNGITAAGRGIDNATHGAGAPRPDQSQDPGVRPRRDTYRP